MNIILQINLFREDMSTKRMRFLMVVLSIGLYISFVCCTYEIVEGIKKEKYECRISKKTR